MKRGAQEEKEVVRGVGDVTSAQRHEREKTERKREREKGDDENGGNDVRRQKVGERERRANVKFLDIAKRESQTARTGKKVFVENEKKLVGDMQVQNKKKKKKREERSYTTRRSSIYFFRVVVEFPAAPSHCPFTPLERERKIRSRAESSLYSMYLAGTRSFFSFSLSFFFSSVFVCAAFPFFSQIFLLPTNVGMYIYTHAILYRAERERERKKIKRRAEHRWVPVAGPLKPQKTVRPSLTLVDGKGGGKVSFLSLSLSLSSSLSLHLSLPLSALRTPLFRRSAQHSALFPSSYRRRTENTYTTYRGRKRAMDSGKVCYRAFPPTSTMMSRWIDTALSPAIRQFRLVLSPSGAHKGHDPVEIIPKLFPTSRERDSTPFLLLLFFQTFLRPQVMVSGTLFFLSLSLPRYI